MSVLVALTDYTEGKSYCRDAFWRMAEKCILPVPGVKLALAGDRHKEHDYPNDYFVPMDGIGMMVEDMLMHSREVMRQIAVEEGFDKLCWQGIDAPWQSREDFEKIVNSNLGMVAPVISARTIPGMAVARRFKAVVSSDDDPITLLSPVKLSYSEEQYDIPDDELKSGLVVPAGFPGGDNISIDRKVFTEISWKGEHKPWYQRVADGETNVECIEWFCWKAVNSGFKSWVDSSVRVWHVDEPGLNGGQAIARLWPDVNIPLEELNW